ncbi:MAG: CHASE2 domain-containing protein, partial [Treponema sp.]|nr:CHASE2 domain-containing protein [Treponema sp.]
MKKLNQTIYAIIFSTISFALGTILFCRGTFNFLENKIYDNRMIVTSHLSQPSDDICFIGIDQESINVALKEKNWSWPWPRSAYGQIVDYMNEGKASNVIFDIFFTEPSVYGAEDDIAFANSCKKYGKVIQTMFINDAENESALFPIPQLKE